MNNLNTFINLNETLVTLVKSHAKGNDESLCCTWCNDGQGFTDDEMLAHMRDNHLDQFLFKSFV